MAEEPTPKAPRSRGWIRILDYGAMAALAAVVLYRVVLPHPSEPLPSSGAPIMATHGMPVFVDLSSTR